MKRSLFALAPCFFVLVVASGCSAEQEPVMVDVEPPQVEPSSGGTYLGLLKCDCYGEIRHYGQNVSYRWFPSIWFYSLRVTDGFERCKAYCHDDQVGPWAWQACVDLGYSGQPIGMRTWARVTWEGMSNPTRYTHDYTDQGTCGL